MSAVPVMAYVSHPSLAAAARRLTLETGALPCSSLALATRLLGRKVRENIYPAALALMFVKEDLGLVVAGMAVFAAVRNRWAEGGVAGYRRAWPGRRWRYLLSSPAPRRRGIFLPDPIGELGSSPGAILTSLVTRPGEAIAVLLAPKETAVPWAARADDGRARPTCSGYFASSSAKCRLPDSRPVPATHRASRSLSSDNRTGPRVRVFATELPGSDDASRAHRISGLCLFSA